MFSGVSPLTSRKPLRKRVSSHDSVFQPSPPKSFAEEVADALSNRVKSIGSSHPSVIIRKQKKLMQGLLDVAEEVRKDFPNTSKKVIPSTATQSSFPLPKLATKSGEAYYKPDTIESSMPVTINENFQDAVEKQYSLADDQDASNSNIVQTNDYAETNDFSWIGSNVRPAGDMIFPPTAEKVWKPPKPKRSGIKKSKKNASLINFFRTKSKKKGTSDKKLKLKDRILNFVSIDNMRNLRERLRCAWTTTVRAEENNITRLQSNVLKSNKN